MNKTLSTILGVVLVASGGYYQISTENATTLENNISKLESEKQEILNKYTYAQLTSGRGPDLSVAPTDEIAQSYVDIVTELGADQIFDGTGDMTTFIRSKADEKGELLNCHD
jgi:hypothetical protein